MIEEFLRGWLLRYGWEAESTASMVVAIELGGLALVAMLVHFLVRTIVVRGAASLAQRTNAIWDDAVVRRGVVARLAHLAPAMVIYHFGGAALDEYGAWGVVIRQACLIYMLCAAAWMFSGMLGVADDVGRVSARTRDLPVRSFVQVARIVLFIVTAIAVLSLVLGKSPALLLSGLGAMTAILMLIFKDAILGFVAGIQLSANRMVSLGDWIEMPKYGADGDVIDVALTTVKVQNWDKTITTIPTYALISESFKNWRGMSESGGRRIKRALHIDMTSIRFCTPEMLERFSHIQHIAGYLEEKKRELERWNAEHALDPASPVNMRRLTNVGTFRAYIQAYLRHHPMIHTEMTFLVRQLAPTPQGLPIEIYVFTRDQRWVAYEGIQGDIFDHLMAVAPEFDLQLYQAPSGADLRGLRAPMLDAAGPGMEGRRIGSATAPDEADVAGTTR